MMRVLSSSPLTDYKKSIFLLYFYSVGPLNGRGHQKGQIMWGAGSLF